MAFSDAIDNAMDAWFSTDFADTITLNGADVAAHVIEMGRDERTNGNFTFIEVEFALDDYASVTFASDYITVNGTTWRYPKAVRDDAYTRVVRFYSDPRAAGRVPR